MTTVSLTDDQWEKVRGFLQADPRVYVGDENEYRLFVEAVIWASRSGGQWRLLPEKYGKWNSVYKRFARWCDKGAESGCSPTLPMTRIWNMGWWTAPLCGRMLGRQALKKNGSQADQVLGRSRGGFSTKIHVTAEGPGNPLRLYLTAGQRHDIIKAADMIVALDFAFVIADRAYAVQHFMDYIVEQGAEPVVPPRKNAQCPHEYDEWLYREQHLVECFIGKIKHFRRVFSRFDKLARRYWGFLQLTSTLIWLR